MTEECRLFVAPASNIKRDENQHITQSRYRGNRKASSPCRRQDLIALSSICTHTLRKEYIHWMDGRRGEKRATIVRQHQQRQSCKVRDAHVWPFCQLNGWRKGFFFFLLGWIARGGGKVKVYHVPPSPSVILVATRHRLLLVVGCGNDPRCVGEAASQQHTHF